MTDVSGAARELCSEEGRVVWRGEQGLWSGYREAGVPQALRRWPGDAANEEISCALRYQGQLYDAESGLYYNRHRYYDPELGQYISPDPIGLGGGIRPQGYVHNPVSWVDPLGLAGCPTEKTRVRQYTNRKGSKAIEENGVIKTHDNNRVYVESAKNKPLGPLEAESKYQIGRGEVVII